jgi:hypothetical protein
MFENKPNPANNVAITPSQSNELAAVPLPSTNRIGFRSLVAATALLVSSPGMEANAQTPTSEGATPPPATAPNTPPVPDTPPPLVNTDRPKPPPPAPGGTNAPAGAPATTNAPTPPLPGATTAPATAPSIYTTVVDLSTHKVTGQVYDNFGTKKDISRATTGQFRQAPAGVLQMVAIGLDEVGRANIPADTVGVITITAGSKTREYIFNPANVPGQEAINPSVFRETVRQDPGLDKLWRSISTANDGIAVELLVMRNNPDTGKKEDGAVFHLYKTGSQFTDDAKVQLSFKKKGS